MIQLITGVFYLSIVFQLFYWVILFGRFVLGKESISQSSVDQPFVSIIIPFKNELLHLRGHLEAILMQAYPNFEVIMVNDHSTDGGDFLVKDLADKYDHLHMLNLQNSTGKKAAIELGIDFAKGDWIGLTDADCIPANSAWISRMMNQSHTADVIIGYGPYKNTDTFLSWFIRYEAWYIALTYMSLHQWGHHYMAVGRNLFFKKATFKNVRGYGRHRHLLSGSDDLFISSLSVKNDIVTEYHPESYIYSTPKSTLYKLWQQKKRHLSTAIQYKISTQLILFGLSFSQMLVYFTFIALLLLNEVTLTLLTIFLSRWVVMLGLAKYGSRRIQENRIVLMAPVMDFLLMLYYISLSFTLFFKPKNW